MWMRRSARTPTAMTTAVPTARGGRVTPFLHGWLAQSGAFADPSGHGDPNHPERTNFENWTELFDPNARGSYQDRFQHGYAGWPTFSAWGNAPLRVYAGDYASYCSYWNNR